jgi:hypothetical protein
MVIENSITIEKDLKTKALAIDLFNAILSHKAPTQVSAMSEADFLQLYRHCFQQLSLLQCPVPTTAIPDADKDDDAREGELL